jgi:hypothetical protein
LAHARPHGRHEELTQATLLRDLLAFSGLPATALEPSAPMTTCAAAQRDRWTDRHMDGRPFIITIALVGLVTTTGLAQLSMADQAAVDAYRSAIRAAESGRSSRGIEAAFSALVSMREALMQVRNGKDVLESLPDEEFQRLGHELPGAIVNREEVVFVEPDPGYFAKLAASRGDRADRAFFSALKATYPESVWPVYVDQQTDYSGCTRFGSLVETYRAWFDFQRKFPGRYAAGAKKETDVVIEHLTTSTCACGDLASVENELQRFLRTFPTSSARAKVGQRLQALRARRSDIRPGCVAG